MDTVQLTKFVLNDPVCKQMFLGVFPADNLSKIKAVDLKNPCCLIANTDIASKSGTHWVGIYIDKDVCMFFDSYGRVPQPRFIKFLKQKCLIGRRLEVNTRCIQGFGSSVCGQYCLFFLHKTCRGHSLSSVVTLFNDRDIYGNDSMIRQWFQCISLKNTNCNLSLHIGGGLSLQGCKHPKKHLQRCKPFQ